MWICDLEKLSIPLEVHHKAQLSEIVLSFQAKSCIFYLLANPAETIYLSVRVGQLSNAIPPVKLWRRIVAVHTFLGWFKARLLRRTLCRNYRKPKLFCRRSYPGEISHSKSAHWGLSNGVSDLVLRWRKIAVHTISHLMPTEAWRSAVSTTWEGRRVSSKVPADTCMRVLVG